MQVSRTIAHLHRGHHATRVLFSVVAMAFTATSAMAEEIPDVCLALRQIVSAPKFTPLRDDHLALGDIEKCHINAHAYDCRWQAHWQADGGVNDPLEELGADIAACLPDVIHDVNTPTRQHFIVKSAAGRVSVTASVQGPHELRLLATR